MSVETLVGGGSLGDASSGSSLLSDAGNGVSDNSSAAPRDAGQTRAGNSVSGQLRVAPNLVIDADNLEPRRVQLSNDHIDTWNPARDEAQQLLAPSWVIGTLGSFPEAWTAPDVDAGVAAGDSGATAHDTSAPLLDASAPLLDASAPLLDASAPSGVVDSVADDEVDYFKVTLERAQRVTLFFEPVLGAQGPSSVPEPDLDLFLLEPGAPEVGGAGVEVADSQGSLNVEQVMAPDEGTFWIAVKRVATSGGRPSPARYVLAVDVPIAPSVQNEISKALLSAAKLGATSSAMVTLSYGPPALRVQSELQGLVDSEVAGGFLRLRREQQAGLDSRQQAQATVDWLKRLRRTSGVLSAVPAPQFQPQSLAQPDDPEFERQWSVTAIDLLTGWAQSELAEDPESSPPARAFGEGVIVAVVDSGVVLSHPDFVNADGSSQLLAGMDMVSDAQSSRDGDGIDSDPTDPGDGTKAGGNFHGTHCAGNIAAATDNAVGIVGTAPRAKILPVRVLGKQGAVEDIVAGILYAAGLPNASGELPAQKADVINLSLAAIGRFEMVASAIAAATEAGSIVVAAAGNFHDLVDGYSPAGEDGVITVSAVASDYSSAWYSNYGASSTSIELAGMGGDHDLDSNVDGEGDDVWSLSFRDRGNSLYYGLSGTSMAAAQVSGVIALMKGVWPAMTTADLMALLPEITVDLGEEGPDPLFGFGLINAAKAVAVAREHGQPGATLPATLRSSSLGLDFGYAFDRLPLELSYFGSAPLQLGDVEVGAPWLHIEPGGLGVNTVSVDREMAKGQQASSELRWLSSAGELVVPVRLGLDFPVPGEVGSLEVALLDADTAAVVARVTTSRSENYAFAFDDLTPGAYRVVVVDDLSGRGLDAQFGALRAQSPLGSGVLCIELERADCRSDLDPADVHPSLAVVADLAIASP